MNRGARSALPGTVASLLEDFGRDTGSRLRLWETQGRGWRCLFPPSGDGNGNGAGGPAEGRPRRTIELGADRRFELEVAEGEAAAGNLAFVAHAVGRILAYEREAELAAQELTERYEEINLLYSISETLGSVMSLQAASSRILTEVADLLSARRASLWVYDGERRILGLAAAVGDEGMSGPVAVDDPDSITARVFRDRQPLNLEQGVSLPRGSTPEPRPGAREAFLSVPIQFTPPEGSSRTVGVITLIGRRSNVRFSAGDVRLLSAIASQIGAALETHRLMEENVRQERFHREMELAHDLQMKLLPDVSQFPDLQHVAARCDPADSVAGDFYHLFRLSEDRLGVMIGDVSGHGFSAALIMALTMSALAIYARQAGPPARVLRRMHEALIGELESTEMYMTLFYAVIDEREGTLVWANAGHPHAFLVPAAGEPRRLGSTSPPFGVIPLAEYREDSVSWNPGTDLLCLFTDGLSDAFADEAGVGGEAALVAEVGRMRAAEPAVIVEHLFQVADSAHAAHPADDRTAVLLRT